MRRPARAVLAPVSTAYASSAAASSCFANWSGSNDFGYASGRYCGENGVKQYMQGTVTDSAADGRCPYVRRVHLIGELQGQ